MSIVPPPPKRTISVPKTDLIPSGVEFIRIFDTSGHTPIGNHFKFYGPRGRLDHHRGLELALGHVPIKVDEAVDPDRGVLYAARTLATCVYEVFQEDLVIKGGSRALAEVTTTKDLTVLDLRGLGTHQNGVPPTIDSEEDRPSTQAWARYLYDQGAVYGTVAGLVWTSRFFKEDAFVFFERSQHDFLLGAVRPLTDPDLRTTLDFITAYTDLVYDPSFF